MGEILSLSWSECGNHDYVTGIVYLHCLLVNCVNLVLGYHWLPLATIDLVGDLLVIVELPNQSLLNPRFVNKRCWLDKKFPWLVIIHRNKISFVYL